MKRVVPRFIAVAWLIAVAAWGPSGRTTAGPAERALALFPQKAPLTREGYWAERGLGGESEGGSAANTDGLTPLTVRGKVVCIPEEMHAVYRAELPTNHEHVLGFKTTNGTIYTLLRTKYSEALFADKRLQERELLLSAEPFPKSQVLQVKSFKSVKNGVTYDLYYYCDICEIQSISPEVCACCQAPVQLIEKPLK
jgi:hypothetical protein